MHIFDFLDADTEDQPSGITIYADGENKEEQEDGEIVEAGYPEPWRKMSVPFPGVNGPIPENANERLWADGSSSSDLSRNRMHHRLGHYSEPVSSGHHREQSRFRDFTDEGPPGYEPGFSPSCLVTLQGMALMILVTILTIQEVIIRDQEALPLGGPCQTEVEILYEGIMAQADMKIILKKA